jgi:hypothetical protein
MSIAKQIAKLLPGRVRVPLLRMWRQYKGNPELNLLLFLADPSKISVDVGANAGHYTRAMAQRSKHCIAFEPIPELAADIRRKCTGLKVDVQACALSDTVGDVVLRIPLSEEGENPQIASVEPEDLAIFGKTHVSDCRATPEARRHRFA